MIPILTKKKLTVLVLSILLLIFANQTTLAEEKERFDLKLSLKLTAGLRYMRIGDINSHIKSFDDYMSSSLLWYKGGKMERIGHYGPYFEGELRIDLSPRLAISVGTGYISGSNKNDFQTAGKFPFTSTLWTPRLFKFIIEPRIKTIPLRLGIYYSLPLASRVDFLLHGGIGYYFSKGFLRKHNLIASFDEIPIPEQPEIFNEYDVRGSGFGLHGGIGLEYKLTNILFLVIDAQGRYVRIKNLKGSRTYWNAWNYNQGKDEGTLYIGTRDMTDEGYGDNCPDLVVSPSQNMKKAALDFSGFSLTLGLRIRLF